MNCPRCWKSVPPESAFCLHCGYEIAATQVVPRAVTPITREHQQERAQGWTPVMVVLIVVALVAGVVGIVALVTSSSLQPAQSRAIPVKPTPRTVVVYVTPTPTPTPAPTTAPQPSRTSRIKFGRGDTAATVLGNKSDLEFHDFYIKAQAGQTMNVELSASKNLSFQVLNSTGNEILTDGLQQSWEGGLPYTGDYIIRVSGAAGRYTLKVTAYPL